MWYSIAFLLFACAHLYNLPFPFSDKTVVFLWWTLIQCRLSEMIETKMEWNLYLFHQASENICSFGDWNEMSSEKPNTCGDNNKWHGFAYVPCLVGDWWWYSLPFQMSNILVFIFWWWQWLFIITYYYWKLIS